MATPKAAGIKLQLITCGGRFSSRETHRCQNHRGSSAGQGCGAVAVMSTGDHSRTDRLAPRRLQVVGILKKTS